MNGESSTEFVTWLGILLCLSQSALFSGLNLAMFGVGRLRLETESATGNEEATKILKLREDSNFLLTTILWGNVGINVLLTLLADSVLTGLSAFLFSTIAITLLGEIIPQASFSRNAMRIGAALSPVLRFYQFLLFPLAKPTALMLDAWLGPELAIFFRERDLEELMRRHAVSHHAHEISEVEATGAANFLVLDDLSLDEEGEVVDPSSIIQLPFDGGRPQFPQYDADPTDPFLRRIHASGKKWVVISSEDGMARLVLDADGFLRRVLLEQGRVNPIKFCHKPVVTNSTDEKLGHVLERLRVEPQSPEDDVIDHDAILLWGPKTRRIVTGADILGRLLRGISKVEEMAAQDKARARAENQMSNPR